METLSPILAQTELPQTPTEPSVDSQEVQLGIQNPGADFGGLSRHINQCSLSMTGRISRLSEKKFAPARQCVKLNCVRGFEYTLVAHSVELVQTSVMAGLFDRSSLSEM